MAFRVHQPRGYLFLKGGAGRACADVLEENYRLDELATRPVIRDEFCRVYRVFADWADFWAWRDTIPVRERCFDEVVFGAHPQHLKFDIDAPGCKIDAIPAEVVHAFAFTKPGPTAEELAALDAYVSELVGGNANLVTGDANLVTGGADLVTGGANLVTGGADLVTGGANLVTGGADLVTGGADPPVARRAAQMRARQEKVDGILNGLIDVILDELQGAYLGLEDLAATRNDVIATDSSGPAGDDYKFSFHLVVAPYAVANNEEAKGFTARVLNQLPAAIRELVDPQVNKSLQNFRLVGSSKPNSGRVKEVTTRFGTANLPREATVIRARPGARVLSRLFTEGTGEVRLVDGNAHAQTPEISGEDLRTILEAVARSGAADAHEFHRVCGKLLLFRRKRPSHCAICGRVHDNDNTLMVTAEPVENGPWPDPAAKVAHRIVEHCRHAVGGTKTRTLDTADLARLVLFDVAAAGTGQTGRQRQSNLTIGARIAAIHAGGVNAHLASATELETVPDRYVYAEPRMRPYESVPTLAVKGQMKLGKTKALREYLDREFPARPGALRVPVIRMVTFRQTFSKSMQREDFRDFELYSDHQGDLDHVRFPRLIVQVESLHRLRMGEAPEPVDLLVLDEVESILAQFNSGLHKQFNAAFAMFQWMLATTSRVICIDANIGDRTLHVLQRMRPGHPVTFHWNQYLRAADDKYFFTANQAVWLDHLYEALRKNQRVVLPTNSLAEAKAFEASVRQRFPEKAVRLYSSRTPPSEKKRHFADVHAHWSDLDVLIYTPTVSAGVSYELEHFDALFGYFTDASCDAETCRQMLARVRSIGTKNHYVCLSGQTKNLPTSVDDVCRLLYDKRTNLYRQIGEAGGQLALQFEYGLDGEVRYHESPYFCLWLETVRVNNLSKNDFVARFIDQVADTGAAVELLEALPEAGGRLAGIQAGQKALKQKLAAAECEAIAKAPDLDPEEAVAVRDRLSRQLDVSEPERLGLSKYRLRDTFCWHGRPLDAAFVAAYKKPEASRVYRNLLRITAGATIVESLRLIQDLEARSYRSLIEACLPGGATAVSACEIQDLHHRYVFQAHFLAVWLLRFCGFRCITDTTPIREETMYYRMRASERDLSAQLEQISSEFQIRRPTVWTAEREQGRYVAKILLSVVNPVLRKMYGIGVKRAQKSLYLSFTKTGRLFVLAGPERPAPDILKPHVPSHLLPLGGANDPDDAVARIHAFLDERFYDDVAPRWDNADVPRLPPGAARPPAAVNHPEHAADDHLMDFLDTDRPPAAPRRPRARPPAVANHPEHAADDHLMDFLDTDRPPAALRQPRARPPTAANHPEHAANDHLMDVLDTDRPPAAPRRPRARPPAVANHPEHAANDHLMDFLDTVMNRPPAALRRPRARPPAVANHPEHAANDHLMDFLDTVMNRPPAALRQPRARPPTAANHPEHAAPDGHLMNFLDTDRPPAAPRRPRARPPAAANHPNARPGWPLS